MSLSVKITTGDPDPVQAEGLVTRVITDADQEAFGLCGEDLEDAIIKLVGAKPTDIYFKNPLPWGDLYKKYKLEQVQSTIEIVDSKVIDTSSQEASVHHLDFCCKSVSVSPKHKTTIAKEVTETVSTSWISNHGIAVGQAISYSIGAAGGETSFNYEHSWGNDKTNSKTGTTKLSAETEFELKPQQAVRVELIATKEAMEVEVTYKAKLSGSLILNYDPPHLGHHFWFPDIDEIMEVMGLENPITATEIIKVNNHSNIGVILEDKILDQVIDPIYIR